MTRLLITVVCLLAAGAADARTWTVGGRGADFPFIAPAIAAASDGDVIEVRSGLYREDLIIDRRLTVVGLGRPTIVGTGVGTVVTIAADGCQLSGFAIEGSGAGHTNAMDAAVQIASDGNRVVDNAIRRSFYGIVVTDASHNEIADNEIHGLSDLPFGRRGDGIYLYHAPRNFVARNRIDGERDAIYFQYAPYGRAVDNIVSDSRYGLHDMFSDDAAIERNVFSDSTVGANIMNSRRIKIEGNRIMRNRGIPGVGLALKDCDDSVARDNVILENARGLLVEGSSSNTLTGNTLRANDTAVTLFSSAERNVFAGNRFVDNWSDVVVSGRDSGTRWSIDGRGNRWSRYRGFDFDGDGVGDSPHPVVGAFERIEGANSSARLFLLSPIAAGLELASHLGSQSAADATDDRPLTDTPTSPAQKPWIVLLGVSVGLGAVSQARRSSCSR
jgi:nitrous oxidase accessory protein